MKTLIYLTSPTYSSLALKEGLDLALVLGTFEQDVSLCLTGDALSLLHINQSPLQRHGKHLYKLLDGLEFYDIVNVYVKEDELHNSTIELWDGITSLSQDAWHSMLRDHTHIYRF
ncbi:sulfur oxidation protein [Marinomonas piezotolerans]|uniref:Sulfur oxidation protein n=1 Tax=Marinomonas piezotolerans TaxID=2213058 RepID=A0A370U5I1_9GAMM|nr:DsrE family protein [Marinomonas piezotolerans]RDL43027.1 sulfur oxidation protein [Marinomonas piezotolerans]